MDELLYMLTIAFYASLYPNLAPQFKWDGDRLIEGPILVKSDRGIGRNCKSVAAIKFRRLMHLKGVYQLPGLPNSTSCSQEMDALFGVFKASTDDKAEEIFERKTFERAKVLKERTTTPDIEVPVAHLTNNNIPEIINGKPSDPLEKRPFNLQFSPENLVRSWLAIGFTPFTREALNHKKVRHTLGDGGASDEMKEKLEAVQQDYGELREKVKGKGLNDFVFNARLPIARENKFLQKTQKEQIRALVENKGAFSAGGQWCHIGVQLLGSEAVTAAQMEKLAIEQRKTAAAAERKATEKEKKVTKARAALQSFKQENSKAGADKYKDVIMFLLPRVEKETAPSKIGSMKKRKEKLEQLAAKFNESWMQLLEEELDKAEREAASQQAPEENVVTESLWEELEIDREKTLGEDGVEDLNPITQAEF